MSPRPPVAVTFDYWDTICHAPRADEARAARRSRLAAMLDGLGVGVDALRLDGVLTDVRRTFDEHWAANRQFHAADAAVLLIDLVGGDPGHVPASDREAIADVFRASASGVPALTRNVAATIRLLVSRGVRVGIVCDVGFTPSTMLRAFLDHHGILDLFDHWSFSDEVGIYKPHAEIFEHALNGLGVDDLATAVHVGDLRRTDVAGARSMGMGTVRYTGANDDAVPAEGNRALLGSPGLRVDDSIEADHVIDDHADLPKVLGLA